MPIRHALDDRPTAAPPADGAGTTGVSTPDPARWVRSPLVAIAVTVVALAGCGGSAGTDDAGSPAVEIEGVETFGEQSRDHVEGPVDYDQDPPVGGAHASVWQTCGAYDQPIADENGVHSMEHGAVWITYGPSLSDDDVNQLWGRAAVSTHVLVSPRDGLPSPVVASAWSTQLQLDGATDDRLDDFLTTYVQGPQTPEPGVTCAEGTGDPL